MSKLQPLENTVVWLKTQAEYDEYMQLAEEAGWTPMAHSELLTKQWIARKNDVFVKVEDKFIFLTRSPIICLQDYKILTLPELKAKFGIGAKPEIQMAVVEKIAYSVKPNPTTWEPHYTKDGHQISPCKIKLATGKEYTPAELQAELNLLRSISKAHKKFFPSAK